MLEKQIPAAMKQSGREYDIVYTGYAGHATELARQAVKDNIGIFAIAGGDGSVHESAKALAGSKTILSIIPAGSGNGIARHFGVELNPEKCLREFLNYKIFESDTWNLNGNFFLGFAGCGFDAVIANSFKNAKKRGFRGYARLVRQEMKKYIPHTIEVAGSDNQFNDKVFIASFCNVNQYGNNIFIDAKASVTDGEISLNILKPFSLLHFPGLLYKSYRGKLHHSRYYVKIKGDEIHMKTAKPVLYHLDGEPSGYIEGDITVKKNPDKLLLLGRNDGMKK